MLFSAPANLSVRATLAALLALTAALPAHARSHPIVAVLPLAAADTGLPYGLLPSRSELAVMTAQLSAGLRAAGVQLVARREVAASVTARGFDQAVPMRSCVVATCAQTIGRNVHADEVIVGAVTREMAVVWGTDFSVVDVRSGRVIASFTAGYKGDVQSMERGDLDAGACIARVVQNRPQCSPDRGW